MEPEQEAGPAGRFFQEIQASAAPVTLLLDPDGGNHLVILSGRIAAVDHVELGVCGDHARGFVGLHLLVAELVGEIFLAAASQPAHELGLGLGAVHRSGGLHEIIC